MLPRLGCSTGAPCAPTPPLPSAPCLVRPYAGLNRFRSAQRHHLQQSASLERTLGLLDSAYYALRRTGALTAHDALARGERAVSGAALPSAGLRFEQLRTAVNSLHRPRGGAGVTDAELLSLWEVFDANGDGMLDANELPSMYDPAGPDGWDAERRFSPEQLADRWAEHPAHKGDSQASKGPQGRELRRVTPE